MKKFSKNAENEKDSKMKGNGQGKRYTPKRRNSKTKTRDDGDIVSRSATGSNDVSWYTVNGQLLNDAAMISYNNPIGSPVTHALLAAGRPDLGYATTYMPSLMVLNFAPLLGSTNRYSDIPTNTFRASTAPVNIQMRSIFSKIQSTVSTKLPFTAADLAIHFGAIDSIYMLLTWAQRMYGLWRVFMAMNRTVPTVYFEGMGLDVRNIDDPDGISMADFRAELNKMSVDLTRLYVPASMDIFIRHSWLCANVFTDAPIDKSQQYMFNPSGFWRYKIQDGAVTAGMLEWVPMPSSFSSLDEVLTFIYSFLVPFYNNTSTWDINAYVLRAYPDHRLFQIGMIPEDFTISPTYDLNILLQIHNADIVGKFITSADWDDEHVPKVVQDENDCVVCQLYTKILDAPSTFDEATATRYPIHLLNNDGNKDCGILVDMPVSNPTPEMNMEATRFKASGVLWTPASGNYFYISNVGTEVINSITLYDNADPEGDHYGPFYSMDLHRDYPISRVGWIVPEAYTFIARMSKFNYAPMIYLTNLIDDTIIGTGISETVAWQDVVAECSNYTLIGHRDLEKLHDAATCGEWFIPTEIKFSK